MFFLIISSSTYFTVFYFCTSFVIFFLPSSVKIIAKVNENLEVIKEKMLLRLLVGKQQYTFFWLKSLAFNQSVCFAASGITIATRIFLVLYLRQRSYVWLHSIKVVQQMENGKRNNDIILIVLSNWKDTRRWKSTRETAQVSSQGYSTGINVKPDSTFIHNLLAFPKRVRLFKIRYLKIWKCSIN